MDKILVVDDEEDVIDIVTDIIQDECSGTTIESSLDGLEAYLMAKKTKYSVIVTDYSMPYMNGVDLIRAIRDKSNENKETTIILISGFMDIAKEDSGAMENVIFLDKPFSPKQLVRYIQMALAKKAK